MCASPMPSPTALGIAAGNTLDAARDPPCAPHPGGRERQRLLGGQRQGHYHALIHPYAMESLTADAAVMSIASTALAGSRSQGAVNAIDGVV